MARIRTIKPEFCVSEQLAECSTSARLLFVLMWMFCDDGGVHPASARTLKMECFPGDPFSVADVEGWVNELRRVRLLRTFKRSGKEYWWVSGWKHQKIDRPTYKYPGPLNKSDFVDPSTIDRRAVDDPSPPESSLPESSLPEGSNTSCAAPQRDASPPNAAQVPITIPLNDGSEFPVTSAQVAEWTSLYPAIDVLQELRNARGWNLANPKRRKTRRGVVAHLTSWLARAQDKARPPAQGPPRVGGRQSQESLEEHNRRVAEEWAEDMERRHAAK